MKGSRLVKNAVKRTVSRILEGTTLNARALQFIMLDEATGGTLSRRKLVRLMASEVATEWGYMNGMQPPYSECSDLYEVVFGADVASESREMIRKMRALCSDWLDARVDVEDLLMPYGDVLSRSFALGDDDNLYDVLEEANDRLCDVIDRITTALNMALAQKVAR